VEVEVQSAALKGNLLGDPITRSTAVYLPKEYEGSSSHYPLLVYLAGFGGSGLKKLAWQPFGENIPQRVDRMIEDGSIGPSIVAFPDCFTSLGGNQYLNSPILGNWEDFLLFELIPQLENNFRIASGPDHRAVLGHSSGGYGALIHGLLHGESWGAVACHSGDMGFDILFRGAFPKALSVLGQYEGAPDFLNSVQTSRRLTGSTFLALMLLAMGASYDPEPETYPDVRLPVRYDTCELVKESWAKWLACDPVEMVERPDCVANLRKLRALYVDCGSSDEYFLHYGARMFTAKLREQEIAHYYEEFEDGHRDVDYRLETSLPFLYKAIRP